MSNPIDEATIQIRARKREQWLAAIAREIRERFDDEEFEPAHREDMRDFYNSADYHYAPERRTGDR